MFFNRDMDENQSPKKPQSKRGSRGPTRMKRLAKRRAAGKKTAVDIDVNTGMASGPNTEDFHSYLGVLSRERISILTNSWDEVSEVDRSML